MIAALSTPATYGLVPMMTKMIRMTMVTVTMTDSYDKNDDNDDDILKMRHVGVSLIGFVRHVLNH